MIDLSTWNLSIPVGTPPATIDTPKLLSGFKGKYFQAEGSSVQFWSPVTGTRTENAIYPRSELRETYLPRSRQLPARHPGHQPGALLGQDCHRSDPRL